MSEQEYIVVVHRGVDLSAVDAEISASTGSGPIPNRAVDVANARVGSNRMTHWMLTEDEATALEADERILSVEIPPELRDDITIGLNASQSGQFTRGTSNTSSDVNWGLRRIGEATNVYGNSTTVAGDYNYALDGAGIDIVIQDSGLQVDHPEFVMQDTSEYISTGVAADSTNGAVFDRSLTSHGIKIVVAGAVGGQTAVPDIWAEKTAKAIQLLIDPTASGINIGAQKQLIATLKGEAGTTHAGMPTAQRIGYGGGSSYTPNWLTDAGAAQYSGYTDFLDSHVHNDMVWYKNTSGPDPSTSDRDIEEIMEHLFHTIHNFGIPGAVSDSATQVPMDMLLFIMQENPSFSWTTTALHLAMKEAIDATLYDPSGYATDWATDYEAAVVAYKEYTYLVNWSMWDMSQFWDGGSLSPEWDDTLKTPAGMKANNPLGYALFNTYFAPVLSKPDFGTLQSIFKDNDAGDSQYTPGTGVSRVQQINWYDESGLSGTQNANHYRDLDGHGTHCAGIAAGKTYGFAKGARVYSQKLAGLEGSGDSGTGISISDAFDAIRLWHNAKTNGRPTVVNMSWAYSSDRGAGNPTNGVYRNTGWSYTNQTDIQLWQDYGIVPKIGGTRKVPSQVSSVNADVEDMIDAGIHVCIAAGNDYYKADFPGSDDYNNQVYVGAGPPAFYHRPSSPYSDQAFIVGNLDTRVYQTGVGVYKDRPRGSSKKGPAVNIWAPGSNIMAPCSNIANATYPTLSYPQDTNFKIMSISGTSMASPQVAGVLALYLQSSKTMTPSELFDKVVSDTKSVIYTTGTDQSYDLESTSLVGGPNRHLFNRYAVSNPYSITGSVTVAGLSE